MQEKSCASAMRALRTIVVAMMVCLPCDVDVASANEAAETPTVTYALDARIAASGSSATSGNGCHRLRATIGEPVAGTSTSTHYILQGGFMAPRTTRRDEIFSNPFESCTP